MTFKEAAWYIEDLMAIYNLSDNFKLPKTTEALDMAIRLLLWMDQQPDFILEGNIVDLLNNYYDDGLRDGFRRAKRVYKIKDETCDHEWELVNICNDSSNAVNRYKCTKCGKEQTVSMGI